MRQPWVVWSFLALSLLCVGASRVWAEGNVVANASPITWVASPTANVKEYRIYTSRTKNFTAATPKPNTFITIQAPATQSTVGALNLAIDGQYYLAITAVGANNTESGYSNEVPFFLDRNVPLPPSGVSVGP